MLTRLQPFAALAAVLTIGALTLLAVSNAPAKDEASSKPLLRHVVLFKFKEGTTPQQIAEVVDAFRALQTKIDTIKGFEFGTDVSPEGKAQGFTHCFFLTFADAAGRDAYLPHPAHKAFGALVGPRLADVLVVDYSIQK